MLKTIQLIFVISFILRLLFTLSLGIGIDPIYSDSQKYDELALNIIQGKGFVQSEFLAPLPPVYPFFLACIYFLFGHNYVYVRIIQALISSFTCIIIFSIGKKVLNEKAAVIASLIWGIYPFSIYYAGNILTETLFVFLLSASILSLLTLPEKSNLWNQVVSGILLGLTTLTRPVVFLFPLLILIWLALTFKNLIKAAKIVFVISLFMIITLTPWILRNYFVFREFVPIATYYGEVFWRANHPSENEGGCYQAVNKITSKITKYKLSEVERNKFFFGEGINFIRNDPKHYFELVRKRFLRFWRLYPDTNLFGKIAGLSSDGILLPLFIWGIISTVRGKRKLRLLHFTVIYFVLFHIFLSYGSIRFRFVISPFFILFAASAINKLLSSLHAPQAGPKFPPRSKNIPSQTCGGN